MKRCTRCDKKTASTESPNVIGYCDDCEAWRLGQLDAYAGIVHVGSVLGACGQRLTDANRTGYLSKATCEACKAAMGSASAFLGGVAKGKGKRS